MTTATMWREASKMAISVSKSCNSVFVIAGGKGGVGKSTVAFSLVDYLERRGKQVVIVDADTANQDFFKAYRDSGLPVHMVDMTKEAGWASLIDICLQSTDHTVVVNTKGSNSDEILEYGPLFEEVLPDLRGRVVAFFVIERSMDSALHLRKFHDAMPSLRIHVLKNQRFGDEAVFTSYDNSTVAQELAAAGGMVVPFPKGSDRITEGYRTARATLQKTADGSVFDRALVIQWRKKIDIVFDELTGFGGRP